MGAGMKDGVIGVSKPSLPQVGSFVKVRGKTWIVDGSEKRGPVQSVTLISCEDDSQGEAIDLAYAAELQPEVLDPNDWSQLLTRTFEGPQRLGAYLRSTEWRTATAADRKLFQAPFRAGIRLDSYQLLPLAKALELPRVNLLIGDDVGLGKTVEAGLIVRELLLRRRIDTIVVAAPASMLLQWQDELAQKFGLDFTIVDREHLIGTRRTRGFSANPWSVGSRFIVSHSVLSDETYTGGLRELLAPFRAGSMFILDEAHHAAPSSGATWAVESQMTKAVREIASLFEHRLFLSATPHNGHSNSFATLLEILDPQRFTRGIAVEAKDLEPVMVRRLKEDLRRLGHAFPERIVDPISISGLPLDAPELRLAVMLDEYSQSSAGGSRARFLFANLQQRLFSSIAAFHRTLTTHRRSLAKKSEEVEPDAAETTPELIEDNDSIEVATHHAKGELGDLKAAIAHVDRMLAISAAARDLPDGRVEAILDLIEEKMLDARYAWQDRRLILFTEWEDMREAGIVGALDRVGGIETEHDVVGRALLLWAAYEAGTDAAKPTNLNVEPDVLKGIQCDRTDALIAAIAASASPSVLERARSELFDRGEWRQPRDHHERLERWYNWHSHIGIKLQRAMDGKRPAHLPVTAETPSINDILIWKAEPGWPRLPQLISGRTIHLSDVGDEGPVKVTAQFVQVVDVKSLGLSLA